MFPRSRETILPGSRWLFAIAITLLAGCAGESARDDRADQPAANPESPQHLNSPQDPDDSGSGEFVEQEVEQLASPFTRETVLKLNAIVERSLSAIDRFDKVRKALDPDDYKAVDRTLDEYRELHKQAAAAKRDMGDAKKELVDSGEKYNAAIFEAMVRFVYNVEEEIRQEIELLEQ